MISAFPVEALAGDPIQCETDMSRLLQSESLALIVGSGASSCMGLPGWAELVNRCCDAVDLERDYDALHAKYGDEIPNDALTRLAEAVQKKCGSKDKYHTIVRESLYRDVEDDGKLFGLPLLSVLGALLMKSSRGSISEVITLNFDDILERYLNLHGFTSQVVSQLPTLHKKSDISIFHMHGFLPSPHSEYTDSENIIFSKISFDQMLGERLNAWKEQLRSVLERKIAIFVGLSFSSNTLQSVLADVGSRHKERGPTGFWYVGPNDPTETEADLINRNIVPIRVADHADTQKSLLRVCQLASRCT